MENVFEIDYVPLDYNSLQTFVNKTDLLEHPMIQVQHTDLYCDLYCRELYVQCLEMLEDPWLVLQQINRCKVELVVMLRHIFFNELEDKAQAVLQSFFAFDQIMCQ